MNYKQEIPWLVYLRAHSFGIRENTEYSPHQFVTDAESNSAAQAGAGHRDSSKLTQIVDKILNVLTESLLKWLSQISFTNTALPE